MGVNAIRTSHNPPAPEFLEITDRLGVLVLDEAFDTWEQTKTTNDYGLYFRDLGAAGHPGDGQAGSQPPQRHPVEHRQRGRRVHHSDRHESQELGPGDGHDTSDDLGVQQDGRPARLRGRRPQRRQPAGRGRLQLRALRRRLRRRPFRPPHLEAARHRDLGRRAQPRHLPHAREHHHQGDLAVEPGPTVLVLRQRGGRIRRDARRSRTATTTPAPSSPVRSSGRGSTTSASRRRTPPIRPRARITAPSTRPGSRRTSTTSTRAAGPPSRWSTSCRTGTGRAGTTVTVFVYSNCDSVELFLNNTSQGSKTMTASTLRLEWNVPWASGTLRADCRRGGSVVATDQVQDRRRRVARRAVGGPDDDPRRRQGPGVRHRRHPGRQAAPSFPTRRPR